MSFLEPFHTPQKDFFKGFRSPQGLKTFSSSGVLPSSVADTRKSKVGLKGFPQEFFKTCDKKTPSKEAKRVLYGKGKALVVSRFPIPKSSPLEGKGPEHIRMISVFESCLSPRAPPTKLKPSVLKAFRTVRERKKGIEPALFASVDEEKDASRFYIKGSTDIALKKPRDETASQKAYTKRVAEYLKAKEENAKRPPRVNYSLLLRSINEKIVELNNPQLRYEMIRKRLKGKVDRCIWNTDEIIKRVNDLYFAQSKKKHEENKLPAPGFDELNTGEIRESIQAELEANEHKKSEQEILSLPMKRKDSGKHKVLLRFKTRVQNCLETIKKEYKATIHEWIEGKVLSMKPFSKRYSRQFFIALKVKDNKTVVELLNLNPYLIYDVNTIQQTGLHIIAKTNNKQMLRTFVADGAYINAIDQLNRTPLYLAASKNYGELAIELITYGADPHIATTKGLTPIMATNNAFLKIYLAQAEKAHSVLKFVYDAKKRKSVLVSIKNVFLSAHASCGKHLYALYNMFEKDSQKASAAPKMTFYELIKQAKTKLAPEAPAKK